MISGYLITCLLLSDWQQTNGIGLKRFWYRRARRLLPALFAMLFVVSLYAILFLPDVLDQLRGEVISRAVLRRELVPHLPRPVVLPERRSPAVAAARVVAGGGGAVLPVLAAHPDAGVDGVGQEPQGAADRRARRRRHLDARDGDPVPPLHRPVARLLRHRHARRRAAARLGARVRVGAVATRSVAPAATRASSSTRSR